MTRLPIACLLPVGLLPGCAVESRRSLAIPVSFLGADAAAFSGADGTAVVLDEARVALADLRLESPAESARLRLPALVRAAHAHPGHDPSGDTACELLGAWDLDLLDPEGLEPGDATCLEGDLATGRVLLSADPAVRLEGTATPPGGDARTFRFEVAIDEEVSGMPVEGTLDPDLPPAGVTLRASPATLLSWVDWTTPDDDGDGVLTLSDGLLSNTVPFGATSTAAYTLTLDE